MEIILQPKSKIYGESNAFVHVRKEKVRGIFSDKYYCYLGISAGSKLSQIDLTAEECFQIAEMLIDVGEKIEDER
jgi:hypothetical protein